MRDFGIKVDGTAPAASGILTADEDNVRFEELENAVSSSGQTLKIGGVDPDDNTQLAEALARYASGGVWYQDTSLQVNVMKLGTALAFVVPRGYFHGMHVRVVVAIANTGAVTANVNNIGVKKVFDVDGNDLVGGELLVGYPIELDYDVDADSGAGAFILTPWSTILTMIRNIGEGVALYKGRNGGKHEFRTLSGVNGTTVVINGDVVEIDGGAAPGGTGEVNYGANVGTGEGLVYRDKSGAVLNFKKLKQGANVTITNGADDVTIAADAAAASLATVAPIWMINEERLGSTNASTLPANVWTKRMLNTTVGVNQIAGASLSNGQVTLPAGSYRCTYCTVVSKSGFYISRLYNVTAGAELSKGTGGDALPSPGYSITGHSLGVARFTLGVQSVLEVQSFCGGTVSPTAGFAGDSQNNVPPFNHVDGWLEIVKEG